MSLRNFIDLLKKKKILHIIDHPISKDYESTEISLKIKKPILF